MSMIDDITLNALARFLDVDVARYKLISSNMANIDTPGYQSRDLDFRSELMRAGAQDAAENSTGPAYASYETGYSPVVRRVRGLMQRPDGNNVSLERESLLLAETQMKYNLGVQLVKDQFHTISLAINSGGTSS